MMRSLACLLLCLTASPVCAEPSLAGTWFGQGQPGDKESMYLDHFLPDGQIHSRFRDCVKGEPINSTEDGTWSVAGDILTIRVARHNGIAMPRTDMYRLTSVTAHAFQDVYLPLNFPYDERRVDDNFAMPGCQLVS
jgi:hypothetical protein